MLLGHGFLLIRFTCTIGGGTRAVEKAAPRKSPKAGLFLCAWKSRNGSGISTFPTAPATAVFFNEPQKNLPPGAPRNHHLPLRRPPVSPALFFCRRFECPPASSPSCLSLF